MLTMSLGLLLGCKILAWRSMNMLYICIMNMLYKCGCDMSTLYCDLLIYFSLSTITPRMQAI